MPGRISRVLCLLPTSTDFLLLAGFGLTYLSKVGFSDELSFNDLI